MDDMSTLNSECSTRCDLNTHCSLIKQRALEKQVFTLSKKEDQMKLRAVDVTQY